MVVTFFGHRDADYILKAVIYDVVVELIEKYGANCFYVGNNGGFDCMVRNVLSSVKKNYKNICYFVVLAYLPQTEAIGIELEEESIYPENLELVPKRFAIIERNNWMISKADMVVTYVNRPFGGAFKFKTLAIKKSKRVIEISDKI